VECRGLEVGRQGFAEYQQDKVDRGELSEAEVNAGADDPDREPPLKIRPVPRLDLDLVALRYFFSGSVPPVVSVKSYNVEVLLFGLGDASGRSFGNTVLTPSGVRYRTGTWGPEIEEESSTWKEFENVAETVEC
jgi:hypothetical protein